MLYVKCSSPLEVYGLVSLIEEGEVDGELGWEFAGNWTTAVGILIVNVGNDVDRNWSFGIWNCRLCLYRDFQIS